MPAIEDMSVKLQVVEDNVFAICKLLVVLLEDRLKFPEDFLRELLQTFVAEVLELFLGLSNIRVTVMEENQQKDQQHCLLCSYAAAKINRRSSCGWF